MIKNFGYSNINIGNNEAGNKTSNLLSNEIMTYKAFYYYIKNNVFSSIVRTIEMMQKFIVKGHINMKSMNYRSL